MAEKKNYKIVLNKIFTGSFLTHNLAHEIINFIKDDEGKRYVYLTPWGNRGDEAAGETEYAFHIIGSNCKDEKGVYELAGVSKIDKDAQTIYSKDHKNEKENSPKYKNHTFYDIFYCGNDSDKAHVYTYKAKSFYVPKEGKRILIKIKQEDSSYLKDDTGNNIIVNLKCNPQHNICYATEDDLDQLYKVINNDLTVSQNDLAFDQLKDEQCFSVISGRVGLELSTSNQIAYFLQKDKVLTYKFLHDFLGIVSIEQNEEFEIVREEKNIDILFKSKNHVVVVENKIDSPINNVMETENENGKHDSQLLKYYNYIEKEYAAVSNRKYYVLAPEYNELTQKKLNDYYEAGDKYLLKNYTQLSKQLNTWEYKPYNSNPSDEGRFLFGQFKNSIEYLTWSHAKQSENTAYIRLKQRIKELDSKNN